MTQTQSDLAGLSKFIFRAPRWYTSLAFALAIAAFAGVAAFDSGEFTPTWRGFLFIGRDAWEGIFFIGVPTVIASFATTGVDRFVGGKLSPNRSSLLALACELLIVAFITVAAVLTVLTPLQQTFVYDALIVALASVFALRLLVVVAVSRRSLLLATVPASIQTVTAAALLFVYSGTLRFLEVGGPLLDAYLMPYLGEYLARSDQAPPEITAIDANHFALLAVLCVLYALSVAVFVHVVDRPWRKSLGVSPLDFLRGFIGHVAEGSRELEEFFEKLGQDAIVPVTVLSFATPDGSEKARFVLPMIHPGPMGEIGGGNFPERVASRSEGLTFPPHATAGHDFNLVTEREVDPILDAVDRAMEDVTYDASATTSVRARSGDASVLGQAFGDDALLISTFAPKFADDVEYGVGLAAGAEARTHGIDDAMLVDAHNSNDGLEGPDLGHVTPGSQRAFDLIGAADGAGEALETAERGDLALGTAWNRTNWTPAEGIGPLGLRVAVTEVAGEATAYVLIDGNNMEPGLRDRLVAALTDAGATDAADRREPVAVAADGAGGATADGVGGLVDAAEVMTTDTHIVNSVEADNQVGAAIDHDELEALVTDLVGEALADREPVSAGMAVEQAEVTVFGNDRTETLASHANVAVSMGGAFAATIILSALAVSVLVLFLAP
jgi:putative membrane protein